VPRPHREIAADDDGVWSKRLNVLEDQIAEVGKIARTKVKIGKMDECGHEYGR